MPAHPSGDKRFKMLDATHEAAPVPARRADRGAAHGPGAVRLPGAGPAATTSPAA